MRSTTLKIFKSGRCLRRMDTVARTSSVGVSGLRRAPRDLRGLCKRGKAEAALQSLREIMGKLKLTLNGKKTRICKVPEGGHRRRDY
jgi:hypothetical protein